jgi:hypothetical protein
MVRHGVDGSAPRARASTRSSTVCAQRVERTRLSRQPERSGLGVRVVHRDRLPGLEGRPQHGDRAVRPRAARHPIKVNAADPGFTATDLNGHHGTQTIEEGARASIRLATLDDDGPSGGFFDALGPVPW